MSEVEAFCRVTQMLADVLLTSSATHGRFTLPTTGRRLCRQEASHAAAPHSHSEEKVSQ